MPEGNYSRAIMRKAAGLHRAGLGRGRLLGLLTETVAPTNSSRTGPEEQRLLNVQSVRQLF